MSININETGFSPALVIMQKNIQTEWNINGEALDGCNDSLNFSDYGSTIDINDGDNIVGFITEADFTLSSWMGILNGYVKIVDDIDSMDIEAIKIE